MSEKTFPRMDIASIWSRFNEGLIKLVDYIPDDKLDWTPKPELWNFRGTLIHIAATRDGWLEHTVKDGIEAPNAWQTVRSKDDVKAAYARTWERVALFIGDEAKLNATYPDDGYEVSGHWIAFHLLEHDIHHRADLFHYLGLLDIAHPEVDTP